MINKKLTAVCLCLVSLGLAACDETGSSSSNTGPEFTQLTSPLDNEHNWQLVGSLTNPCEGYDKATMDWNPSAANPLHFEKMEGEARLTYILADVHLEVGDEFKFATNDKWGGDIPYSGLDSKSSAYDSFEAANASDPEADHGSANIKCIEAGDYNFYYRYWYAMESETYSAAFQVEKVAE